MVYVLVLVSWGVVRNAQIACQQHKSHFIEEYIYLKKEYIGWWAL